MTKTRRDLAVVLAFVGFLFIPFLNKAFHVDEPFFLAAARHLLSDPLHPYAFDLNWYGRAVPFGRINNTPPLFYALLAGALALTGGAEWALRACFLPFHLAAAAAIYLLAARFLKRPLLPVLIAIGGPAYALNLGHLMPEGVMAAFAFGSLYALVRGVDDRSRGWYWGSAALMAAALATKYAAVFLVLPAAAYSLRRGVPARRVLAYLAAAFAPLAVYLAADWLTGPAVLGAAWRVIGRDAPRTRLEWVHKLRALLAFIGGCGVVTVAWPYWAFRLRPAVLAACAAAAGALFLPILDLARRAGAVDRMTGLLMAAGALATLAGLASPRARRARGWALWASWAGGVALLQLLVYWSVMARLVVFLVPPLVFAMAEQLEKRVEPALLIRAYGLSLCAALLLGLSLAEVDYLHARIQKAFAAQTAAEALAGGTRVWFTGHWGLQYYLERAGAVALDEDRGGWDQARPGDLVIVPRVNTNISMPPSPRPALARGVVVSCPIPLRLMRSGNCEAGFYSSVWGFLPYSLCREPLEQFLLVTLR